MFVLFTLFFMREKLPAICNYVLIVTCFYSSLDVVFEIIKKTFPNGFLAVMVHI